MAAVGLFPDLAKDQIGGVQTSGRLTAQALRELAGTHTRAGRLEQVRLLEYRPRVLAGGKITRRGPNRARASAVAQAVAMPASTRLVLVWHLDLVPLLTVLRTRRATVTVFLLGIEAWRPVPPLVRRILLSHRFQVRLLAISGYTWDRFRAVNPDLGALAHCVVPLGIGCAVPSRPGVPEGPPTALMLGRMARRERYKGHAEVLVAWSRVMARLPEARLWVAGDGDLRPELEGLAGRLGLGTSVRFLGQVSEAAKQDLIERCRALALPSRGEGFGLVYAEAMRLGRPCLVGPADGGREVVNPPEAGLAADPADPEALAGALCRLLTPGRQWDEWSAAAEARYRAHFTATHFQRRLAETLLASLEASPASGTGPVGG